MPPPARPAPAIDLNADMGESFGRWSLGADAALLPLVTSANIACGFHAGDPGVMAQTVAAAAVAGVAVGAHPGYPDLAGFGRRNLDMSAVDLEAAVLYQIGALAAFARAAGVAVVHVKPHGALYNRAAVDAAVAEPIARAVRRFSADLILVGLAGSLLLAAGESVGLPVAAEAFADRAYEADGTLRDRRLPGAVLSTPAAAAAQAVAIAQGRLHAHDGTLLPLTAATLCIHGDTPDAVAYATTVRAALDAAGVVVRGLRAA
ncbi:MAG: LamB/YcsF family protein [Chloroflexota bacterium]|nr:LamB/YcsF family protein [Chloroflexota bacterium]